MDPLLENQQTLCFFIILDILRNKLVRLNMLRQVARNVLSRRIGATECLFGRVQMRGMAQKRVENASQAAGEAKDSSPEVRS